MSTVRAAVCYGPAAPGVSNASNTVVGRPSAISTVTAHPVQFTLALTMGYHVGPLFIVQKRRAPVIHGGTLGGKRRRRREKRATPRWLTPAQKLEIRKLYLLAEALTEARGELWVVDHIVPLDGKLVCGLHVPWNMRVLHWLENSKKGWGTWPDMPFEQLELL
ncbi:HNH endonuclease signature motif containing protein [Paraburkholderia sp. BL21I4N1]|uniref:HNH endonuclease signature motif containing protein n=1 Tax=Paraburkholderia sp. BL21I4N1 TaxID=1938801 RepID=UPI000D426CE4|nr:HNH endonuclease signature motif containing protein [Paraburkholderia sp. BL21I4N1]PQV51836.1 hypothetical protein B0G83_10445 [Paraburkholderia sp. BL21I4N1]